MRWPPRSNPITPRCGRTLSLQRGAMAASAVCLELPLSEVRGVWWVLAIWRLYLKLIDPDRTAIPTVKWRMRLCHYYTKWKLVPFMCCVAVWLQQCCDQTQLTMVKCSVGIVVLRYLPQVLPEDAYWVWQKSTETEKRCSNLKESLHIQMLLCLVLFPPAESVDYYFFLQTFVSWKIYGFTTISSHLCCLQGRHNSISTLWCPIACILFFYSFSSLSLFYLQFFIFFPK